MYNSSCRRNYVDYEDVDDAIVLSIITCTTTYTLHGCLRYLHFEEIFEIGKHIFKNKCHGLRLSN